MEPVSTPGGDVSFAVMTPWTPGAHSSGSAIAIIQLMAASATDLDAAMQRLGLGHVQAGGAAVRDLCGIDHGLVIRWNEHTAQLTTHGGTIVLRRLIEALSVAGLVRCDRATADTRAAYPEARDAIEACMLDAVSCAASPLAVDVLLHQSKLWRDPRRPPDPELDRVLDRLLRPPTVVAVGRPNVGKSSLVNALARRQVAIVSPEAGTTRDHLGVTLELDGLVVRWVDTPGVRPDDEPGDELESAAARLASSIIAAADLVVLCADREHGGIDPSSLGAAAATHIVRCGTRSDLGPPQGVVDVATAAASGEGLSDLARLIRQTLVPDDALGSAVPWRFHAGLP